MKLPFLYITNGQTVAILCGSTLHIFLFYYLMISIAVWLMLSFWGTAVWQALVSFAVILGDALLAPGCRVSGGCGLARGCGVGLGATGGPRVGLQGWFPSCCAHRSLRDSVVEPRARVSRSGWLETAFLTGPQQGRCSCCGHSGLCCKGNALPVSCSSKQPMC